MLEQYGALAVDPAPATGAALSLRMTLRQYDGLVWEQHPLVPHEVSRRRGVGRAMVQDLEAILVARGALTLWAGSDDAGREWSGPAGHLSRKKRLA